MSNFKNIVNRTKYIVGDEVTIHDRGMKTNSFHGEITGVEPSSDKPVYNVRVQMRDRDDKLTGAFKNINFLEHQLTRKVKSV